MAQIIEFPHNDCVVRLMHQGHVPMTRENYLILAYGGDMPPVWTGEHEDEMPAGLRDVSRIGRIYEPADYVSPHQGTYRGFGSPPCSDS
jgi:hypothetical protein